MSAQIYSIPGQTEGMRKAFLEWTGIDWSSKLSLTCGGNVNYYKSVHPPIATLGTGNGEHPGNFKKKKISKVSFQMSAERIRSMAKLKRKGNPFLEGARMGAALWDCPQEQFVVMKDEKVCPFVKFKIILPPPLSFCLLDLLTNEHCRALSSMINFG